MVPGESVTSNEHIPSNIEEKIDPIPGYYSVIPQKILLDENLTLSAIRLYGLLTSLARKSGYVFATNTYLSKQLNIHYNTVSKLLKLLEDKEYILRIFSEDDDKYERKILVAQVGLAPPTSKSSSPLNQKVEPPSNDQANPSLREKANHINNKEVININDKNTSSYQKEVEEIKDYWEEIMGTEVSSEFDNNITLLLDKLTVGKLKKAIFNRSKAEYYITQKPEYKRRPSCFFNWPETVFTDLDRRLEEDPLDKKFNARQMIDFFHKNNLGGTNGNGYSTDDIFYKLENEGNMFKVRPEMKGLINQ